MGHSEAKKLATQFLKESAAIIKKHDGLAPKLSGPNYRAALNDTTKAVKSMSTEHKVKAPR